MNIAISAEGRWGGIYWGYQVIGQFQSEEEIRNYPVNLDGNNNRTLLPGDFIYKDVNGDGIINGMDERPIGYPEGWAPIMSFGGNIGLQWKGIDLNIDLSGGAMQDGDRTMSWPMHIMATETLRFICWKTVGIVPTCMIRIVNGYRDVIRPSVKVNSAITIRIVTFGCTTYAICVSRTWKWVTACRLNC